MCFADSVNVEWRLSKNMPISLAEFVSVKFAGTGYLALKGGIPGTRVKFCHVMDFYFLGFI